MVLDGSDDAAAKAESMLNWDVSNGVARRYCFFDIPIMFLMLKKKSQAKKMS